MDSLEGIAALIYTGGTQARDQMTCLKSNNEGGAINWTLVHPTPESVLPLS